MAEATDRPQEALPGPAWPAEGVTLTPAPPPTAPETYRPLSGLALAAFLLALLYAAAVALGGLWAFATAHPWWLLILTLLAPPLGALAAPLFGVRGARKVLGAAGLSLLGLYALLGVGGLVAYSHDNPWLLPGWTVLIPAVAAGLAWFARGRIRDSEGTLGGAALATWGLGLSLAFGLTYVAYYAGAYVAVRQQAESFSRDWVKLIAHNELAKAYVQTMPPRDRPTGEVTRDFVEMRSMGAAPPGAVQMGPSGYGFFCQTDFVRAIALGGDKTNVRPQGIIEWAYKGGNPEVKARYRIETDVIGFDLIVTATAGEARPGEGGRQWQILMATTGRAKDTEFMPTDKGRRLMRTFGEAGNLAQVWLNQVSRHEWDQAYLETLPPAERDRQHQARVEACDPAAAAAIGLAGLGGNPQARAYLEGRARLFSGALIRDDKATFWTPSDHVRQKSLERIRQAFSLAGGRDQFSLRVSRIPLWEREGDRFRFLCDSQVEMASPTGAAAPAYVVEAALVVEGEAPPDAFPAPESWRVVRLDLLRGRTGGQSRPMPGQGGPPGAAPGGLGAPPTPPPLPGR
jgi:hypothetical protein